MGSEFNSLEAITISVASRADTLLDSGSMLVCGSLVST
jgi:hypothetical protein